MNSLENELHCLNAEQEKEVNQYLDSFVGLEYGFWPFSKKIKTYDDVHKFFDKYPDLRLHLDDIGYKYKTEREILEYEYTRMKR